MDPIPIAEILAALPRLIGDPLSDLAIDERSVAVEARHAKAPVRVVVGADAPVAGLPAMPHLEEGTPPPAREDNWVAPPDTPAPRPLTLTPSMVLDRDKGQDTSES